MDRGLLERVLAERGEPGYRARQAWGWATEGVPSYEAMTTLPKALRADLDHVYWKLTPYAPISARCSGCTPPGHMRSIISASLTSP